MASVFPMRVFFSSLIGLFAFLLAASAFAQPQADSLRVQFNKQVERSCGLMAAYQKTVTQDGQAESRVFRPANGCEMRDGAASSNLPDEVKAALKHGALDPRLKGEFVITGGNGVWKAALKANAAPTELIAQELRFSPDGRSLSYVRSQLHYDSYLYDTYVVIEVHFDAQGRYLSHRLDHKTSIPVFSLDYKVRIDGRADYSPLRASRTEP